MISDYNYCWRRKMATEMRNLQTNIHDGDCEIADERAKADILECLCGWELELTKIADAHSETKE